MSVTFDQESGLVRLANPLVAVEIATEFGPRVLAYQLKGRANVFVQLPEASLEWRPGRSFRLHGGHRLWLAPEEPELTYVPDDAAVTWTEEDGLVTVSAGGSEESPFAKSVSLQLEQTTTAVTVTHSIRNDGVAAADVAPWAITMLRPEGTLLMPLRGSGAGALQADRNIVVWPYTRLDDPGIGIDDEAVVVRGNRPDATKIGTSGSAGWGAYVVDGMVFTKAARYDAGATYADLGASLQCYAKDTFCELETLGPLTRLAPGESVEHVEKWELQPVEALAADSPVTGLIRRAGL